MSYFQKHLKTVGAENQDPRSSISHSQVGHRFKKNLPSRSKVSEHNNTTVEETIRATRKTEHDEHHEPQPKQGKPTRRE